MGGGYFVKKSRRLSGKETRNQNLRKKKSRSNHTGNVFPVYELPGVGMLSFA